MTVNHKSNPRSYYPTAHSAIFTHPVIDSFHPVLQPIASVPLPVVPPVVPPGVNPTVCTYPVIDSFDSVLQSIALMAVDVTLSPPAVPPSVHRTVFTHPVIDNRSSLTVNFPHDHGSSMPVRSPIPRPAVPPSTSTLHPVVDPLLQSIV